MIQLHIEPRRTVTWEVFQRDHPSLSIALDGYVSGPPAFNPVGPHANFDHHLGVDRLSTRSTCMQVYYAITLGLFETFQRAGKPTAKIYINDADPDVCLSVWLLRHPQSLRDPEILVRLQRLLSTEDAMDSTAGSYPMPRDSADLQQMLWVFAPYFDQQFKGAIGGLDAGEMCTIIEQVGERIGAFTRGLSGEVDARVGYRELGGGPGWRLVEEESPLARCTLFASGVRAFIAVRELGNDRWTYTVGRMSPFVPFPLDRLYQIFNEAEGTDATTGWGGGNTVGGSPRRGGSRLNPKQVEAIINNTFTPPPPADESNED